METAKNVADSKPAEKSYSQRQQIEISFCLKAQARHYHLNWLMRYSQKSQENRKKWGCEKDCGNGVQSQRTSILQCLDAIPNPFTRCSQQQCLLFRFL
jgi:hypothetical protein